MTQDRRCWLPEWLPSRLRDWLIVLLVLGAVVLLLVGPTTGWWVPGRTCAASRSQLREADRAIAQVRQGEEVPASLLEQREQARAVLEIHCRPLDWGWFQMRPGGR